MAQSPSMYHHYGINNQLDFQYCTDPGICPTSQNSFMPSPLVQLANNSSSNTKNHFLGNKQFPQGNHFPFKTAAPSSAAITRLQFSPASPLTATAAVSPIVSSESPYYCQVHYPGNCNCYSFKTNSLTAVPDQGQHKSFFLDENSMNSTTSTQSVVSGSYNENFCEELEETLNELPLESLLQMTHLERQMINENEEKERGNSSTSQGFSNTATPSFYSSKHNEFNVKSDAEDFKHDINELMGYPTTSLQEPAHLNTSFSQNPVADKPSCNVSDIESSVFDRSTFDTSFAYDNMTSPESNINSPNPSSTYSDLALSSCSPSSTTTVSEKDGEFLFPASSDHNSASQKLDPEKALSSRLKQSRKSEDISQMNKKSKRSDNLPHTEEKISDSQHESEKSLEKEKTSVSSYIKDEFVNPGVQSLMSELHRKIQKSTEKEIKYLETKANSPPDSVFPKPLSPVSESDSLRVIRKRRRCPRGMTLEKKPCDVCGDLTKNMHFGGLVCDSCKAFFRRSVQSNTIDTFKCEKEGNCELNKANRRSCQYCRFQKCTDAGMKMEWVMTESGRINLLKNRLARTRHVTEEKEKEKIYGSLPRSLDEKDAIAINDLLNTLHESFSQIPYPNECSGDSIDTLSNIFVYLCKRFGNFFLRSTEKFNLHPEDRTLLLKNGIAMSLYINGAHMYDPVMKGWPAESTHESLKIPFVSLETLERLAEIPEAFSTIMNYYNRYESELKDPVTAVLMYAISFYSCEDSNFICVSDVRQLQDKYMGHLRNYLIARDGYQSVTGIFLDLMEGLNYIKEILKYHAMVDIKPTVSFKEVPKNTQDSIMKCMSSLVQQMQISLGGSFPEYASVFKQDEKDQFALFNSTSSASSPCSSESTGHFDSRLTEDKPVMHNHPNTIAIFGEKTRTDSIIMQPLENIMQWENERKYSVTVSPPPPLLLRDNEDEDHDYATSPLETVPSCLSEMKTYDNRRKRGRTKLESHQKEDDEAAHSSIFSNEENLERRAGTSSSSKVDIDDVCDILRRLSHTDDLEVLSALKQNIPKELLDNFSKSLSEDRASRK